MLVVYGLRMVHTKSRVDIKEGEATFMPIGNLQPVTMEVIKRLLEELKEENREEMNHVGT